MQTRFGAPAQFNFSRQWRRRIVPLLDDADVRQCLATGLMFRDINYEDGDAPWLLGRGPCNGQRAREGCLSWYQPWGCCHHIAPFCWGLGKKMYPALEWGFVSGKFHTVVVGHEGNWQEPKWVLDILLFRDRTANESLEFAALENCEFFPHLAEYLTTFATDREAAQQTLLQFNVIPAALRQ